MAGSDLLPFDAMWPTVAAEVVPLETETVAVQDASRRILRTDATAAWDLPRASNSAMDGYAVRSADTVRAAENSLRVLDRDAYAGSHSRARVEPGTAVPIGTGGVVPPGADAIAPKEIVRRAGDQITVTEPLAAGSHVRHQGEELRAGATVVAAGERLGPLEIAAAAAAGVCEVVVGRLPRVAVLTTGTELVPVGAAPQAGQVVDTNGPLLAMSLEDLLGVPPCRIDHAVDDPDRLSSQLTEALTSVDLLLTTGGVSVGDRDLVKETLETKLGVERLFWRVAQKPGKPTYAGRRGSQWVIGLPGNPAAVAAAWHLLVRPLVLASMGAAHPAPPRVQARLAESLTPNGVRTLLRWCRAAWREGQIWAEPLPRCGSHMLSDFARSDLLVLVPAGNARLPAGAVVEAIRL